MKLDFDVVIIGSGVAGMSAALYLKRASISCCLLEKEMPGGQINRTSTIENYPGIISITGPELAESMLRQVQELGVTYQYGDVENIISEETHKTVITKTGKLTCKYVIIASGRRPKKLEIENEEELSNRGISWCAICDGPLYKNKKVAVIGGGNSAVEESIYLSSICNEVTLIHRGDSLKAQSHLIDRLNQKENIKVLYQMLPQKFEENEGKLSSIILEDRVTRGEEEVVCDGCFIYIGQEPNTTFLKNLGILDDKGYVIVDEKMETKVKNIFAVGDVIKKELYQIVTATSDGAVAATAIVNRN